MFKYFSSWNLQTKILVPLAAVSVLLAAGIYGYFSSLYRETKVQELITKARAVVVSAEGAREFGGKKYASGIYRKDLRDVKDILLTVPVIGAMRVAAEKAEELGFEFKVPKFSPRNPKNQPDEFEASILRKLEGGDVKEYWTIDENTNKIRYFRPIKLTPE